MREKNNWYKCSHGTFWPLRYVLAQFLHKNHFLLGICLTCGASQRLISFHYPISTGLGWA